MEGSENKVREEILVLIFHLMPVFFPRELITESPRRAEAMGILALAHDHSLAQNKSSINETTQTKSEQPTNEDVEKAEKKS